LPAFAEIIVVPDVDNVKHLKRMLISPAIRERKGNVRAAGGGAFWRIAAGRPYGSSMLDQQPLAGRKLQDAVAALAHEGILGDLLRPLAVPAVVVEEQQGRPG
jgi:hypothetical protein